MQVKTTFFTSIYFCLWTFKRRILVNRFLVHLET